MLSSPLKGISKELDLLDAALHYEVITKSGSWLSFNGAHIAQGREQALDYLRENKEVCVEIAALVMQKIKGEQLMGVAQPKIVEI